MSVKVVGSYLLGTVTKPDLNVDIAVEMPKVRVFMTCLTFSSFFGSSLYHLFMRVQCTFEDNLNLASYKRSARFMYMYFLQVNSRAPSISL